MLIYSVVCDLHSSEKNKTKSQAKETKYSSAVQPSPVVMGKMSSNAFLLLPVEGEGREGRLIC